MSFIHVKITMTLIEASMCPAKGKIIASSIFLAIKGSQPYEGSGQWEVSTDLLGTFDFLIKSKDATGPSS